MHSGAFDDEGGGWAEVSAPAFWTVSAFALPCLGFHWFGGEGWIPVLDSANLALHEAGHPLVGLVSARASVYGGTLMQLAFPLAAAWHFRRARQAAGFAAAVIWLGENLFNIARYMADARAQMLPLVGGDHDWTEILGRWGALRRDTFLAGLVRIAASALILGAGFWLWRRRRTGENR
jgi:hypothetical protein